MYYNSLYSSYKMCSIDCSINWIQLQKENGLQQLHRVIKKITFKPIQKCIKLKKPVLFIFT